MKDKMKIVATEEPIEDIDKSKDVVDTTDDIIDSGDYDNIDDAESSADSIESDLEEPDYANDEQFNEIRDIIKDSDFRLFLINETMGIVGKLDKDGNILFMNIKGTDDNKEITFVQAPTTFNELSQFQTLYHNIIDDKEVEVPHDEITEYLRKETKNNTEETQDEEHKKDEEPEKEEDEDEDK